MCTIVWWRRWRYFICVAIWVFFFRDAGVGAISKIRGLPEFFTSGIVSLGMRTSSISLGISEISECRHSKRTAFWTSSGNTVWAAFISTSWTHNVWYWQRYRTRLVCPPLSYTPFAVFALLARFWIIGVVPTLSATISIKACVERCHEPAASQAEEAAWSEVCMGRRILWVVFVHFW